MAFSVSETRAELAKSLSRIGSDGDAAQLVRDLQHAANICTRRNIEQCTMFVTAHIVRSGECTQSFCRLLLALCASYGPSDPNKRVDTTKSDEANTGLGKIVNGRVQQPPQPHFKRLHILYVINDVLLTLRGRAKAGQDRSGTRDVEAKEKNIIKRYLPMLFALATFTGHPKYTKSYFHVLQLLKIWLDQEVFSETDIAHIHASALKANSNSASWGAFTRQTAADEAELSRILIREAEDARIVLPRRHGVSNDPAAPWHELPAANGLYMKRTRGYPLKAAAMPMGGYELDAAKDGIPDPGLKSDVQWLHKEMLHAFDKYANPDDVQDIDALGNLIYKDPDRPTRNYWGWSLDGIGKIKETTQHFQGKGIGYGDIVSSRYSEPMGQVNSAVERARTLAAERGAMRGRGGGGRGGRGWRGGGRRW